MDELSRGVFFLVLPLMFDIRFFEVLFRDASFVLSFSAGSFLLPLFLVLFFSFLVWIVFCLSVLGPFFSVLVFSILSVSLL